MKMNKKLLLPTAAILFGILVLSSPMSVYAKKDTTTTSTTTTTTSTTTSTTTTTTRTTTSTTSTTRTTSTSTSTTSTTTSTTVPDEEESESDHGSDHSDDHSDATTTTSTTRTSTTTTTTVADEDHEDDHDDDHEDEEDHEDDHDDDSEPVATPTPAPTATPPSGGGGEASSYYGLSPIIRVDALTESDRGAHLYAYLKGTPVFKGGGFYGHDFIEVRQPCDSYSSASGAYSTSSRKANCPVESDQLIQIHQSEAVYGTAQTNGTISSASPYGGDVCSDFEDGCPNTGVKCSGSKCSVPGLNSYDPWATYCPSEQSDVTIASSSELAVAADSAPQRCWNKVTVNNHVTLTLTSTTAAYYIETFDIANNATINIAPSPSTGRVTVYVKSFSGDKFNGNQVVNTNNRPCQLQIHYLGTSDLTLDGNAEMRAFIDAPYAGIKVQGNFEYFGGIRAKDLTLTGSAGIHYDESCGDKKLTDVKYQVRKTGQHFR